MPLFVQRKIAASGDKPKEGAGDQGKAFHTSAAAHVVPYRRKKFLLQYYR